MIVTLDTNVVLQAVASRQGASAAILDAVFAMQLEMALSVPVFKEYESVLLRPQLQAELRFTVQEAQLLLQAILRVGRRQQIFYLWRPNLQDEQDNLFVELAVASQSTCLITSNIRDFRSGSLALLTDRILTPAAFLKQWRNIR